MAFDQAEYIKTQNEKDAAIRAGKTPEPTATAVIEAPVIDDDDDEHPAPGQPEHKPDPGRSQRRRENRLREEAAEERGRRKALEEMMASGLMPKGEPAKEAKADEDPEPDRKDFPDDAAYNRALGRWEGRQGAVEVLKKAKESESEEADRAAYFERVAESDKKAAEDRKLIPDFDEVAEKAIKDAEADSSLVIDWAKQPTLFSMLRESDVQAFMMHHYAKTPDDLRKILAAKPAQQINMFRRLEGKVEVMYSTKQQENVSDKKTEKPKQETAAERDAKKARPSESGAPKGGSAPVTTVKPYLDDGKTINPAWKVQQNERENLRR